MIPSKSFIVLGAVSLSVAGCEAPEENSVVDTTAAPGKADYGGECSVEDPACILQQEFSNALLEVDSPELVAYARDAYPPLYQEASTAQQASVPQACDVLAAWTSADINPLNGYIVIGMNVDGTAAGGNLTGGVDLVWDLWNEQFAAFTFSGGGVKVPQVLSIGVGGYAGIATAPGGKRDVIDAWSGAFNNVSAAIEVPGVGLFSGGGQGYASPDGSLFGVAVGGGVGFSLGSPGFEAGFGVGDWSANNELTGALSYDLGYTQTITGKDYLELSSGPGTTMARHFGRLTDGTSIASPAIFTGLKGIQVLMLAVGAAKSAGVTYSQACTGISA